MPNFKSQWVALRNPDPHKLADLIAGHEANYEGYEVVAITQGPDPDEEQEVFTAFLRRPVSN